MKNDVNSAVEALKAGALIVMPTDTVYGLAASPDVPGAVEKIYMAKRRDARKPIPLLASGVEAVEAFGAVMGDVERRLAEKFWPGPLTLILDIDGSDDKEGFRIPDHDGARELLALAGGVLRVTSANESGEPPALTAEDAEKTLGDSVEVVLDSGCVSDGAPSTVVRIKETNSKERNCCIEILREGAISRGELEAAVEGGRKAET